MALKIFERALNETFYSAFNEENGILHNLLEIIKSDPSLIMCLRGDYTTVYYRGLQILKINQNYTFEVNKNYGINNDFFTNRSAVNKYKEGSKCYCFEVDIKNFDWIQYFKDVKYKMDKHCYDGQEKLEKEIQQIMFRENSYNAEANGTDYIIFDVENADDGARYDLLAVYWSRYSRSSGSKTQFAIIELKANIEAIKGNKKKKEKSEEIVASLFEHYKDAKTFIRNINDENNKKDRDRFFDDRKQVFTQMINLGLINTNINPDKLSINDKRKKIQFISAIANYNDKSDELQKQIEKIQVQEIMDPCSSMEILFATSSCLGYGLYERYMLNANEMLVKLPQRKNKCQN